MDKKLVVGNWKMNLTVPESTILIEKLKKELTRFKNVEIVVCPTYLDIYAASKELSGENISVGSQNLYHEEAGPFTGEVSALQLANFVEYAIIGHSERRSLFSETDKIVAKKAAAAFANGITPIVCVGETYHERGDGLSKRVVLNQVEGSLSLLTAEEIATCAIAYEPVWAIGTGLACENKDIEKMAKDIRGLIKALYGENAAKDVRILYGGSVTNDNAEKLEAVKGIDGVLVGGASLDYAKFTDIVRAFDKKESKVAKKGKPDDSKK